MIAIIGGVFLYNFYEINFNYILIISFLCILFMLLSLIKSKYNYLRASVLISFFLLAYLSCYLNDEKKDINNISNKKDYEQYLAQIISPSETKSKTYKANAKALAIFKDGKWEKVSGLVLLYFNKEAETIPNYGDIFLLRNNIREIEAPKNPFEFDYKTFQARKYIYNHQFLRADDFKKLGNSTPNIFMSWALKANNYAHNVFLNALGTAQELAVADALISGQKAELDFETKQWYTQTGAIHVLAVSGMHVAILFIVLNALFGLFLSPKKTSFFVIIISILWLYALFTGFSPSVCRATLMFSILQFGQLKGRDNNTVNTLLTSAIILLLFIPNWLYDVGFQLSYLAVLGILILNPYLKNLVSFNNKILAYIWELSTVSVSAQIFTLPLSLYYFHQFPNYFLIANPVVSIVSNLVLPLGLVLIFLSKIPILGTVLAYIFKYGIIILNKSVEIISQWPYALTKGFDLSILDVCLLFILIFLSLNFIKSKDFFYLKLMSFLIILIPMKSLVKTYFQNKQSEITFQYIPKTWGISIIEGRKATFIAPDSIINEPLIYQYHLKNYYDSKGVNEIKTMAIIDTNHLYFEHKNMGIQRISNNNFKLQNPLFLMVSNNALKNNKDIYDFKGHIILDGSNTKYQTEKLLETSLKDRKNTTILYNTGSKTYFLK